MEFSTTNGELYIVELAPPFERLEIQFIQEEIAWSRQADLSDIQIVGRNHPKKHHTGGSDSLSLELDFYSTQENRQDVIRKVRWLQSITYNDGGAGPARNIKLVWGDLFQSEVWVVKRANARLSQFMPQHGMLPQQAMVDLKIELDPELNRTLIDARG